MYDHRRTVSPFLVAVSAAALSFILVGCERKERVFDLEAPGVDVEVDRTVDSGEVETDIQVGDEASDE